jgi:hypothetical protein
MSKITRVLIANRGETAVRIIKGRTNVRWVEELLYRSPSRTGQDSPPLREKL